MLGCNSLNISKNIAAASRIKFACAIFLLMAISGCSSSGTKQTLDPHLKKIMDAHIEEAKQKKYKMEDVLELTKPLGVWDMRAINTAGVKIGDNMAQGGEICHFHHGFMGSYFNLPQKQIYKPMQDFLDGLRRDEQFHMMRGIEKAHHIIALTEKIVHSRNHIFVSEKNFQRVDDVFCQDGRYWKYSLDPNSPFSISEHKVYLDLVAGFSDQQNEILSDIKDLGLYGAYYNQNCLVLIKDGMLNYSFGYILSPAPVDQINAKPYFNFINIGKVSEHVQFYFYVAN